jgi:glyoxylase-like metal-dependent hydrolase (beta-lactamase superfamily II)
MRAKTITDNLTQLTRLGFVNAYLVREDDGFTLVDTTIAGAADALIGAARAAGGEIRRIVLTHGHGDHVGSLDALEEKLGVPVYMPELDARIHAGEKPYDGKLRGSWPKLKTVPDVRINAGDRVGSLEVHASPGHTPGHVSLLDTRDRALLAGDAVYTVGGIAVPDRFRPRFPLVWFATWDRAKAGESAQALRALEPTLIGAGHGKVTRDPIPPPS